MWSPPSANRPRKLGAREIPRTLEVFDACRRQRHRKVPRVLRQVFGATPSDLILLLEPPEDLQRWDDDDRWGDEEAMTG
jgi:hypothetical protein